jgi:hypothetical protein
VRNTTFVIGILLASGCGAGSHAVRGPDGSQHQAISCRRSIENCWEEAARVCERGYDIVDKDSNITMVPTANGPIAVQKYNVLVRCR